MIPKQLRDAGRPATRGGRGHGGGHGATNRTAGHGNARRAGRTARDPCRGSADRRRRGPRASRCRPEVAGRSSSSTRASRSRSRSPTTNTTRKHSGPRAVAVLGSPDTQRSRRSRSSPACRLPSGVRRRRWHGCSRPTSLTAGFSAPRRQPRCSSELRTLGIGGGAVYDALVGATAREHGLTLMTRDRRALETYRALDVRVELVS